MVDVEGLKQDLRKVRLGITQSQLNIKKNELRVEELQVKEVEIAELLSIAQDSSFAHNE